MDVAERKGVNIYIYIYTSHNTLVTKSKFMTHLTQGTPLGPAYPPNNYAYINTVPSRVCLKESNIIY